MIPFQTIFAVSLTCEACIKDVSTSLYQLNGITNVTADLSSQLISIEGTAAPSSIVAAIQQTGRDAILRGSGASNSAAVAILETHSNTVKDKVRGLARMVQVAPNMTVIDLTIRGLSSGTYHASIRETGDISRGAESTGRIWEAVRALQNGKIKEKLDVPRGMLCTVVIGKNGIGSAFLEKPVQIWEIIGRSLVVSKQQEGEMEREHPDTLVGVVARSAGVWDNSLKTVCSCSGKTIWEEREEQTSRGML